MAEKEDVMDPISAPLPEGIAKSLQEFVDLAQTTVAADLRAIVLFGSAAEGRLRTTSDVNVLVVLGGWNPARLDALRDPLRNAQAAIGLAAMFVLESELPAAMDAFAVKFSDILRRRRVLCGQDPFAGLKVSRQAEITRLRQVLLNLVLRMRERYLSTSLREEQAAHVVAQVAGPLRASAATLLGLAGKGVDSPKAALEAIVREMPGDGWPDVLGTLSQDREGASLAKGVAPNTLLRLVELATAMHHRASTIA
jgi:predicted nucleotidyltransferase